MGVRKTGRTVLICFTGLDGSGKSTLAKALVVALNQRGIESRHVYSRFEPLLSRPLLVLGRLLLLRKGEQNGDYRQVCAARQKVLSKPGLAVIYQFLTLFDYWWQMLVRVVIPLKLGKTIVCDRYTYDTIINLAVDLNYSDSRLGKALNRFSGLLPKPELVFVMDVPEEIALQRKCDIPSIDYLKERRRLYLHLARKNKAVILDGTKDLTELETIIRDKVLERVIPGE